MKVDIFDFDLDRSLIADKPASPRDSSKLLDLSEEDRITDRVFYELPEILHEGDVLVFNDTKVIPARLYGKRGKAQVEVTLYHPVDGIRWQSFIKNAKRLRPGDTVAFYTAEIPAEKSDFTAEVLEKNGEDGVLLKFDCDPKNLGHYLEKYGSILRETLRKVPSGVPAYVWTTCGDTSLSYEQSPEDLLCQLFMLYLNGGKGAVFYSAYGIDAREYQAIAEVIRTLHPYENLIADGQVISAPEFTVPSGYEISGIGKGKQRLIYLINFDEKPGIVNIHSTSPPKNVKTVFGNEKEISCKENAISIRFDPGQSKIKVLLLEK